MGILILVSIGSYLVGAIPFGLFFSKIWGVDPRKAGSKNIGATNVLRTAGILPAILTLVFDISKGGIAVVIARMLEVNPPWIAGLAAIIGHNFPVYLDFKGGKGVATSIGTMVVLYPLGGASVIAIWLIVAAITRYSSLAALVSLGVSPVIFTLLSKSDMIGFTVAIAVLAFMRHRDNIKRLLSGTEKKIGDRVLILLPFFLFLLNLILPSSAVTEDERFAGNKFSERLPVIKEEALDRGLRFPEPVILYVLSGHSAGGDEVTVTSPLLQLDPASPFLHFKKAEESFGHGIKNTLFNGIPDLINAFKMAAHDMFWFINLVLFFSVIIIFSFIFAISVSAFIKIPLDIPILIHEIIEKKLSFVYILIIIASALIGLPYFALSILLIGAIHYPTRSQKICLFFCIIFLLLLPFILRAEERLLRLLSDPDMRAIYEVNEQKDNLLILLLNKNTAGTPKDSQIFLGTSGSEVRQSPEYLFSRALALKKEGRLDEAIEIFKGLAGEVTAGTPKDSKIFSGTIGGESNSCGAPLLKYKVFNNLGNCLFLKGDLEGAEQYYQKAIELKKNPQTLYNLSQLYKERLDFEKGKYYYEEAMKLDAELISVFTKISLKTPNRFLMDLSLTQKELFKLSFLKSPKGPGNIKVYEPLIPLILLIFLFIKPPVIAYRCSRCGKIICNICQRRELWGRMCPECYEALVTPDKVDSKTRLQRLLFVQKKKSLRKRLFWVLSIFPGVNQTLGGWLFQGLLILSLLGMSIMCLISANYFTIMGFRQFYVVWIGIFAAGFAIIIHLISLRRLSRIWP